MKPLPKAEESILMRMYREDFERGTFDPTKTLPFRVISKLGVVGYRLSDEHHVRYAFPWLNDIPDPHGREAENTITMLLAHLDRYQKQAKARVQPHFRRELAAMRKKIRSKQIA